MSYGWNEEVLADSTSARFRLGDAGASTTAADAIGGAAGTVRGGVTFGQASLVESDADGAALFNGIDGYISVANRPEISVLTQGGFEAWIVATSYRDRSNLGGCIMDGGARELILLFAPSLDGTLLLRVNSVGNICTSLGTVPLNARTHVAVTINPYKILINGSDVTGPTTAQTITANALPFCIGAADGGASNFFQGTIDEASVYTAATPTRQRFRAHYNAAFGVPKTYARSLPWLDQTFASSARTLLRVSNPAGAKVGDLLCLALKLHSTTVTPSNANWTTPAGGLQTNTTASKSHELVFMWHRIRADDPATWDITWDGSSLTTEAWCRVVRGAPASTEPVNIIAGASLTSAGTTIPFGGAIATGRGLAICIWASFGSDGFPNQPDDWHYGAGLSGGVAAVGSFEREQLGAGRIPYMTSFTGSSTDAWTTLQVVINDGGIQQPFVNPIIGLDGVNSPNDRANPGWPDGYTPALAIGANFIRTDFGPGTSQSDSDAEFADAAARGMRILPIIWQKQQISTIDATAFCNYVGAFVARYGPGGTFWARRTDGYLAPEYIEPFNEPWGWWYTTVVEPAAYASLHIQAVRAGRASNPRCKYLLAGIDRYWTARVGGRWADWFAPMFAAQPTLGQYADGITVHLYGTHPLDLAWWGNYAEWPQLESIVPDLISRGLDIGGAVKIWATECGFNTASNTGASDYGVSEANQASMYTDALRLFFGRWSDLMSGVFFYRYRDGTTDNASGRWGIVHNDGTDKPAKTALTAWLSQYQGAFVHKYGPDQWLPNSVWKYDGSSWRQPPSTVVAG
ncbi:MAG TPA: LamG-like jellyroll fold domain-containing protein [Conexibacter sp.]|jgi:hypothetical protein|nr:LamG-like jellyroll fold domain-containing protein [Conexibacter sp.]